jgi:dUTP pyrophosphatase
VAIPEGFEGQVRPRSGLAVKHGISLPNTPATIDSDYRGEIRVPLINLGREAFLVSRGMRIAQLIVAPVARVTWDEVQVLQATDRGGKGFGHSGV